MEMSTTALLSDRKSAELLFYSLFLIHRFGVFVAKLMEELVNAPQVSILLASNLPANNYTNNAYR